MPLPEGYTPHKVTWVEWFQDTDDFVKASYTGIVAALSLGSLTFLVTRNKRWCYHVGWCSYIGFTGGLWSYKQRLIRIEEREERKLARNKRIAQLTQEHQA